MAVIRASAAALVVWAAFSFIPPLQAAARSGAHALVVAMEASRLADARRVRLMEACLRFQISYPMAEAVDRAARAEGIDPELGFRLVRVESAFHERAVSPVGALGLTQLMPTTAQSLQQGVTREALFDRDTNLRLGFRYLRQLLRAYDGQLDLALQAYNRGPGTVDRIRAAGGDPANGYAVRVLGQGDDAYRGTGLTTDHSGGRR
ncbi:MAG TPA: transglycosylase SLT domain-containing protein [Longimicrobiaceae bacterium]|nr:transglycosylase SLT domain-containing protein [Longimicrobiaceae bacterium]